MLSFGIIASSGAAQAGITNWDYYAPTGEQYRYLAFGNGTAVTYQQKGTFPHMGYSTAITSSIILGQTLGSATNIRQIAFANNTFVGVGGPADTRRIIFSTNGTSWGTALNSTSQTGDNMSGVTFGNGLWIAPVRGDNDVYTSTSGTAFTEQAGVLASAQWTDATWNGSVYGIYASTRLGDAGGTAFYTSANGTTWTARTLPATPATDVVAGSGVIGYMTAGFNGLFYSSSNGTAFTLAGTAFFGSSNSGRQLAYGNGVWVALSETGGTVEARYSSNNGFSWSTATFGSAITQNFFGLAYDSSSNAFYIVVDDGATSNVYKASVVS